MNWLADTRFRAERHQLAVIPEWMMTSSAASYPPRSLRLWKVAKEPSSRPSLLSAGRTSFSNPKLQALLGCSAAQLAGRPCSDFLDAADCAVFRSNQAAFQARLDAKMTEWAAALAPAAAAQTPEEARYYLQSYQQALDWARNRVQGKPVGVKDGASVAIVNHPDVKRMLLSMRSRIEAMRALVYSFYDQNFSFKEFVMRFPHLKGDLTDCLIGNLFRDFDPLFSELREAETW